MLTYRLQSHVQEHWQHAAHRPRPLFQPFSRGHETDMFWSQPFNLQGTLDQCKRTQHLTPRPYWAQMSYGGRHLEHTSNIVFSNGELDPWRGGGVAVNSSGISSIVIGQCGHHCDLMFSTPDDTAAIRDARRFEMEQVRKWIQEKGN